MLLAVVVVVVVMAMLFLLLLVLLLVVVVVVVQRVFSYNREYSRLEQKCLAAHPSLKEKHEHT